MQCWGPIDGRPHQMRITIKSIATIGTIDSVCRGMQDTNACRGPFVRCFDWRSPTISNDVDAEYNFIGP